MHAVHLSPHTVEIAKSASAVALAGISALGIVALVLRPSVGTSGNSPEHHGVVRITDLKKIGRAATAGYQGDVLSGGSTCCSPKIVKTRAVETATETRPQSDPHLPPVEPVTPLGTNVQA